jgi:hypothetical protein
MGTSKPPIGAGYKGLPDVDAWMMTSEREYGKAAVGMWSLCVYGFDEEHSEYRKTFLSVLLILSTQC